ncbi:MAG: hypothetical protein LC797_12055, partial [Chloroflexi bacterium]|nr:hypothetical protein [Chloroflexota bacterium]
AAGAAAAVVGFAAAVGADGAALGEQAARVSAKTLNMPTGTRRRCAVASIAVKSSPDRMNTARFCASRYHVRSGAQHQVFFRSC